MYRKQNSKTKAIENYKLYLDSGIGSAEKNVESAFHIHKMSQEIGRRTDADDWRKKTLGLQRRAAPNKKGPGARYAAALALEDSVTHYNEMKGIQMPKDVSKQKAAAEKKIAMITKLNGELAEIVKYDSPDEIVGALTIVGEANYHMGQTFVNAETPPGLNAEQVAKYKETIAGIAEPFFAKSKESLKAALDRASELDTFNAYYDEARNLLVKIDPTAVYEGAEKGSDFRQGEWIGL
jgi:hypothetical protein